MEQGQDHRPEGAAQTQRDLGHSFPPAGTRAAEGVQVYGYFSKGIEPVIIRGWRGSVNEGEVTLERIPRLAAGQEMIVKISAQAHRPGDHVFRAEVECGDPETKLAVEEWTRFYGEPDLDTPETHVTADASQLSPAGDSESTSPL